LIHSSDVNGVCYVETKNLDGETNLKTKQAKDRLNEYFKSEQDLKNLTGTIECKNPNEFIYEFDGNIKLTDDIDPIRIDHNCFLLRGCNLRRTKTIFAVSVYTGHNTKIMKNSPSAKWKVSKIEKTMNIQILTIFIMQIILSCIASFFSLFWYNHHHVNKYYKISQN